MKKTFKILFITGLLLYLGFDTWIYFQYKKAEPGEREMIMRVIAYDKINNGSLPPTILKAYEKVYPGIIESTIYPDLAWICFEVNGDQNNIYRRLAQSFHLERFTSFSMANQIESKFSPEECIAYELRNFDFLNQARGIYKATELYYSKKPSQLTEQESLELVIMTLNPSVYNKLRHPEALAEKAKEYPFQ